MARELSRTHISDMPSRKLKAMVMKILTGLERTMEGINEILNEYKESYIRGK